MLDLIRHRAQSWGVKVIFGIIILVFVAWGVGSNNPTGPGTVASVNGKPILMQDFQRELHLEEEQFRGLGSDVSPEILKSLRLPEKVLSRLVNRALIEQEAKRLGITLTPTEYVAFLHSQSVFKGDDGKFSQAKYEQYATNVSRNIAEFEQASMRDLLMRKMESYITAAAAVTPEEARRRLGFEMEKRTVSYVLFSTDEYRDGITITDEAIKSFYDSNQAQFARPATISVAYIDVTPAAIAHTMDVSDEEIDAAYAKGPLRYNLRQALVPVPEGTDQATEDTMKAKLAEAVTLIQGGQEFAEATKPLMEAYPDSLIGDTGWIEARRVPEELLGALAGLGKGELTKVIKMEKMLVFLQLVETDPDWTLPEADIKTALRAAVGEDKAALAFRDIQAQAEDMVALGKPLAEIAKELKVDIKTTNPAPREELVYALNLRKPGQIALFEGDKGSLVNGILETQEGFVVAEIGETTPAGVKPQDEVADLIRDVLVQREAEKKSEEAARAVAAEFAKGIPEAYSDKLVTTEPFTRQGNIPDIGYAKSLADAIFAAPLDAWLKDPFATPKGAVIAMPAEVIPLSDEEWEKIQDRAMELILDSKRGQMMNAFLAGLHKKAEITVATPEIFEQ